MNESRPAPDYVAKSAPRRIPPRIAAILINALKGGVVPRVGLPWITVGRAAEIEALLRDIDLIAEGGAAFRFIVGRYGSGKSFLIQSIRNHAMDRGFVTADADLSPDRRLWGKQGQGLATYRELIANLATKTRPEGGALGLILDRWITALRDEAAAESHLPPADNALLPPLVESRIASALAELHELPHGFDFAKLLVRYYRAGLAGDEEGKNLVLRWFRGEFSGPAEARAALGVRIAPGDEDWYDYLKLLAGFLSRAGYSGLVVFIDELVNIWKAPNPITRQYNYEKILTMYNDTLQGKARRLGIVMGATPQCVEDRRRGLFSYEALRSRLEGGRFSRSGDGGAEAARDILAPVIRLRPLSPEELLVLTEKLADIHAALFGYEKRLAEQELADFIRLEFARVGAVEHLTPREVIRDFIELLNIIHQHPETDVATLLASGIPDGPAGKGGDDAEDGGGNFAEFEL